MSEIITNKLTGKTAAGDVTITSEGGSATMQLQQGVLKAWANFQQTSTQTVNDSLNVGSITDNGAGDSTLNFTSSMGNANFTASSGHMNAGTKFQWHDSDSASNVVVRNSDRDGGSQEDADELGTQIAGDLA
jgi:plastocyanin